MKKRVFAILLILSMAFFLLACDDSDPKEDSEETEKIEYVASEQWEKETVGPMSFDAPVSWKASSDEACYSPPASTEGGDSGYSMSVYFSEDSDININSMVDIVCGRYDDVNLEYSDVLGYKAACAQYTSAENGKDIFNITYYIQIYPDSGLGIIHYGALASDPELYRGDFERLFNSISIDGEQKQEESNERTFVLNKSTGAFHKPSCYKVKQIENPETVVSTYDEMISEGYVGCELCNPK